MDAANLKATAPILCYHCNKVIPDLIAASKVARSDECPYCYTPTRCCRMCLHFDRTVYNECREPSAERIVEKEKANFCDYYILGDGTNSRNNEKADQLAKAASLFKF